MIEENIYQDEILESKRSSQYRLRQILKDLNDDKDIYIRRSFMEGIDKVKNRENLLDVEYAIRLIKPKVI